MDPIDPIYRSSRGPGCTAFVPLPVRRRHSLTQERVASLLNFGTYQHREPRETLDGERRFRIESRQVEASAIKGHSFVGVSQQFPELLELVFQ